MTRGHSPAPGGALLCAGPAPTPCRSRGAAEGWPGLVALLRAQSPPGVAPGPLPGHRNTQSLRFFQGEPGPWEGNRRQILPKGSGVTPVLCGTDLAVTARADGPGRTLTAETEAPQLGWEGSPRPAWSEAAGAGKAGGTGTSPSPPGAGFSPHGPRVPGAAHGPASHRYVRCSTAVWHHGRGGREGPVAGPLGSSPFVS